MSDDCMGTSTGRHFFGDYSICNYCYQPKVRVGVEDYVIYRFYDSSDALLYVGITNTLNRRLRQHARDKTWYGSVTSIRVSPQLVSRDRALEIEWATINASNPKYNVARNPNGYSDEFMSELSAVVVYGRSLLRDARYSVFLKFTHTACNNADYWGRPSVLKDKIHEGIIASGMSDVEANIIVRKGWDL